MVEFALCNYGSQIPRLDGNGLAALLAIAQTISNPDGSFSQTLVGNDHIDPAGTYYLLTVKDQNGDVSQCNAYIFLEGNSYNLNDAVPFDPSQQLPPVIPPTIISQLQTVAQDFAAPEFDGGNYTAFQLLMTLNITGAYLAGLVAGNLYTFIIIQDSVGGHAFNWPSGPAPYGLVNPAEPVCQLPNSITVQTFVANNSTTLLPIGPATYYTP
jgi:hypothetical protein